MTNPVPANLVMSVRLEAIQWNTVLGALGKAPYEIIKPVIESMEEQLKIQSVAQQTPPADEQRGSNGIDHPPHEPAVSAPN